MHAYKTTILICLQTQKITSFIHLLEKAFYQKEKKGGRRETKTGEMHGIKNSIQNSQGRAPGAQGDSDAPGSASRQSGQKPLGDMIKSMKFLDYWMRPSALWRQFFCVFSWGRFCGWISNN